MSRNRFVFGALCAALVASLGSGSADAGHDQSLYHYAVFPAGHWIGHGEITTTHAGGSTTATMDGSFTFDLTVKNGVVTGTMAEEVSGTVTGSHVSGTFQGLSAGSGYTLTGNAGRVVHNGSINFTGQMTGNGRSFPINMSVPATGGTFAPDQISCGTASGNMALPAMKMMAQSNTTVSWPWTAVNVGRGDTMTKAQAAQLFTTVDAVNEDVEKIKAGDKVLDATQARALIEKAQAVIASFVSAEHCQGGSHLTGYGETFLATFEDNVKYLQNRLKAGGFS